MINTDDEIWHWHHNISECYYHIQLTVKYRKSLMDREVERVILEITKGLKERYTIDVQTVGFDKNHVHFMCRFLPTYSGGQVIRIIKSLTAKAVFKELPRIKNNLWGGEFWTDGYYISTVSGRGSKATIEKYITNQGRKDDVKQLRLFEL
ncbi:MAG: IS200/IS605 family transposase [Bacteroidia bacterium]